MNYRLEKDVMVNDRLRAAFNDLALEVFEFSFEKWYQDGYWDRNNQPYTLFDGGQAIANISINCMEVLWQDEVRHYIQLGTVMSDPAYRQQGLVREIMNQIRREWDDKCDAMFLFANKSVLDFYPKLGFKKERQYQYSIPLNGGRCNGQKLNMESAGDRDILRLYYEKTNPFSEIQVINSYSVLMFYCSGFMKEWVCYLPENDVVVIAEQDGRICRCYDIFGEAGKRLEDILDELVSEDTGQVILGFTPKDKTNCKVEDMDDQEDNLFVLNGKENIFPGHKLSFPLISHT